MRIRLVCFLVLLVGFALTLSLTRGQDRSPPPSPSPSPAPGAVSTPPAARAPAPLAKPLVPARDLTRLSELQKQMLVSAQQGAEWLHRMNGVKGRFLYGYLPALKVEMEGDHYLRQAGAACALARAARFLGEERYAVRAAQAILALLDDTATGPTDSKVRCTVLPPGAVNRVGAAGMLVLAINELPAPQADLLDKSEQLCNYLRSQARPDGALALYESADVPTDDEVSEHAGVALYALMVSQKHRPATWKTDLVRKALPYYRTWWRAHKNMAFVPWQTAAYAEAYLKTNEKPFAEFVTEMNDWLCGLQYAEIDRDLRRVLWHGGFMSFQDGRATETAPDVGSAACAEALAQACRVARATGDVTRHQRYSVSLERCLQFLATLQFTDANTNHFANWYRPRLHGAFYASHKDGNLRIDNTQHAVSAMLVYLEHVVP